MNSKMKLSTQLISFILLFFFYSSTSAQQLPLIKIGLKDGLPQSSVGRITQDNMGYVWFATQGGLCRYDGIRFKVFSQYDGIGSNFITDIQFDPKGMLWLSTIDKGICSFDGTRFKQFNKSNGLFSEWIRSFIRTSSGDIFISSIDQGLIWVNKYNHQKIILTPEGKKFPFVRQCVELKNGNVWVAFEHGIVELVKANQYKPRYRFSDPVEMICLSTDAKGDIWAGGVNCLLEFTKDTFFNYSDIIYPNSEVWDVHENPATGEVFIATTKGLIVKKRKDIIQMDMSNGLTVNDLRSLYQDKSGNLWTGTQGGGVMILENKGIDHFTSTDQLQGFTATTISEEGDGTIWIGTNNQGLIYFNGKQATHSPAVKISDLRDVLSSTRDPKTGSVWFANYDGEIVKINGGKIQWRWKYKGDGPLRLLSICYHKNVIYLATQGGCYTLDQNNQLTPIQSLKPGYYGYVFCDKSDNIWFLGDGGSIFKYSNGTAIDYTGEINPQHASLTQGMYDPYHRLYWFTSYAGLIIWDGTRTYQLHSRNGLCSDSPWSICQDKHGDVWVGHPNGIERISYQGKSIKAFGYDQGFTPIETNSCAIHCDKKGNVWYGTISSATRVRVNDLNMRKAIVNLCIQKIWVNEKLEYEQDLTDHTRNRINLSWRKNNIVIDLMGICFENGKDVTYSWCLQGFDNKWTNWDTHTKAIYSNLRPGTYTFRAKAKDPNGYETQPVTLKITIHKPIWNYWWFYGLEICIMAFIIYLSFRFSVNPEKNKLGNLLTLVSILIIFEGLLIYVSEYVDSLTAGIPIFQLIMNVILAGTLHPLEQFIRKFMRRQAIKKRKQKIDRVQDTSD